MCRTYCDKYEIEHWCRTIQLTGNLQNDLEAAQELIRSHGPKQPWRGGSLNSEIDLGESQGSLGEGVGATAPDTDARLPMPTPAPIGTDVEQLEQVLHSHYPPASCVWSSSSAPLPGEAGELPVDTAKAVLHCHASRGSGSNLHIEEARLVVDQGSTDPRPTSLEVCVTEIMGQGSNVPYHCREMPLKTCRKPKFLLPQSRVQTLNHILICKNHSPQHVSVFV